MQHAHKPNNNMNWTYERTNKQISYVLTAKVILFYVLFYDFYCFETMLNWILDEIRIQFIRVGLFSGCYFKQKPQNRLHTTICIGTMFPFASWCQWKKLTQLDVVWWNLLAPYTHTHGHSWLMAICCACDLNTVAVCTFALADFGQTKGIPCIISFVLRVCARSGTHYAHCTNTPAPTFAQPSLIK